MKIEVKITDENGNEHLYNVVPSADDEQKNLNDFILKAILVSEDKRKLPLLISAPNSQETFPSIKMKYGGNGNPFLNEIEALIITWRD
jgi:hypothetical protein